MILPEPIEPGKAHAMVKAAIDAGRITRPERCETCGRPGFLVGHHPDYRQPLFIQFLCGSCHRRRHTKMVLLEQPDREAIRRERALRRETLNAYARTLIAEEIQGRRMTAFAKEIGCTVVHLCNVVNGRRGIGSDLMHALCQWWGTDRSELVGQAEAWAAQQEAA